LGLAIAIFSGVLASFQYQVDWAIAQPPAQPSTQIPRLPPLRAHPLPPTLAQWQDSTQSGDYFDQIKSLSIGYLVWSSFPVTIYIDPLQPSDSVNPSSRQRAEDWIEAVQRAVQEWRIYLPLEIIQQIERADIVIRRSPPPIRLLSESDPIAGDVGAKPAGDRTSTLPLGRVRSAETRFELYPKRSGSQTLLAHRFTILLRPDQAVQYLQAAARHELGHALGIWGHSPLETDALYFSQVRHPASISPRDVNTLKRVYQQPTRLGWSVSN
jgi:predicted Zn-dependent protease